MINSNAYVVSNRIALELAVISALTQSPKHDTCPPPPLPAGTDPENIEPGGANSIKYQSQPGCANLLCVYNI